ncbi:hypothetical protein MJO28_014729 [Puccinia striiformis f. sp. tritici]|uniref:Uncharacterized protein n=1 Tax=Puccinia striiformis f. sp. tritici TaxID=168172 RepID=A0ACC0DWF8_9BASI|nr:hypothetical protein Pst134EA_027087 [Puccinia striiformis f. sp. tritici]KAH9450384.1 hypothetical protein Pst134EA_027087 [Puccinia striiformis f. sp. tritici]KAI7939150.1 hypothetical protein MJO28_014729 [Puccinia striiformis f. sp. tritici]
MMKSTFNLLSVISILAQAVHVSCVFGCHDPKNGAVCGYFASDRQTRILIQSQVYDCSGSQIQGVATTFSGCCLPSVAPNTDTNTLSASDYASLCTGTDP